MQKLKLKNHHHDGFTLIELLVVISIIALLIGILLPALGAARRTARQMQNGTQVRGIHQALVLFAQSNNSYYPGLTRDGGAESDHTFRTPDSSTDQTGNHVSATSPGYRFRRLVEDGHFTGEYMISPSETKTKWASGVVDASNFSYALLEIDAGDVQRENEWRQTNNSQAVVISDRAIEYDATDGYIRSVHTDPQSGDEWRGSIGFNDNHVVFEPDEKVDTKFGRTSVTDDNLFAYDDVDGSNDDPGDDAEGDAAMVYDGPADLIDGD